MFNSLQNVYSIFNPMKLSDLSDVDKTIASSELVMYAAEWYQDDSFTDTGACPDKRECFYKLCEAAEAIVTETDQNKVRDKFRYVEEVWTDLMKAKENLQKKLDACTAEDYGFEFQSDYEDYDNEEDDEDEENI